MINTINKKLKRHKLRKKQTETNTLYAVHLNKELTLQNVIKTQEQADIFMTVLKSLSKKV